MAEAASKRQRSDQPKRRGRVENLTPFNSETAREAQKRSAAARRERAKSALDRLSERVDRDVDEMYESYKKAWRDGGWQAADAMFTRVYGRPETNIELSGSAEVRVVVESCFELAPGEDVAPPLVDAKPLAQLGQGETEGAGA